MNRIDIDTLKAWTGTDADLARHCGVTRQAIHHARLTHGIPAPINGRVGPRHGLGRTLCTAVIREATRRAGSLADDAVRLDAIRAVLDDLNAWHKGGAR